MFPACGLHCYILGLFKCLLVVCLLVSYHLNVKKILKTLSLTHTINVAQYLSMDWF